MGRSGVVAPSKLRRNASPSADGRATDTSTTGAASSEIAIPPPRDDVLVERAAPSAGPRLQDAHVDARGREHAAGGQARVAGADDEHLRAMALERLVGARERRDDDDELEHRRGLPRLASESEGNDIVEAVNVHLRRAAVAWNRTRRAQLRFAEHSVRDSLKVASENVAPSFQAHLTPAANLAANPILPVDAYQNLRIWMVQYTRLRALSTVLAHALTP